MCQHHITPPCRYCCDVNGFSFVKNSRKYYDDASQVEPDPELQTLDQKPLRFLVSTKCSRYTYNCILLIFTGLDGDHDVRCKKVSKLLLALYFSELDGCSVVYNQACLCLLRCVTSFLNMIDYCWLSTWRLAIYWYLWCITYRELFDQRLSTRAPLTQPITKVNIRIDLLIDWR